ncbi:MAG: VPDSG-CTERM sorting domain-containing protein [Verrucomicrobiae bacterium]|nr:VPDSG-CTERM sorting domain-containing protein [Verrucomicrobiae bacterium]
MKIKNILAVAVLVGLGVSAQAVTITFLENGANTTVGSSSTFTESGASLTAYASPGQTLYAKSQGAGETGLGINSDPTGDHEIYGSTFIQLLSSQSSFAVTSVTLGSTTGGEVASIYYSTVLGVLGTLIGSTTSDSTILINSIYQNGYIGIAASGPTAANVLLGPVTGTVPDGGTTVAMLGLGLTAVGLLRRKLAA